MQSVELNILPFIKVILYVLELEYLSYPILLSFIHLLSKEKLVGMLSKKIIVIVPLNETRVPKS